MKITIPMTFEIDITEEQVKEWARKLGWVSCHRGFMTCCGENHEPTSYGENYEHERYATGDDLGQRFNALCVAEKLNPLVELERITERKIVVQLQGGAK